MKSQYKKWGLVGLVCFVMLIAYIVNTTPIEASQVYLDEVLIGTTDDSEAVQEYVGKFEKEVSANGYYEVEFDNTLHFEDLLVKEEAISNLGEIQAQIDAQLDYETYGYQVLIDGLGFKTFRTEADAKLFLERVKGMYADGTQEASFSEVVSVNRIPTDQKEIVTVDYALEIVGQGREELETYSVLKGDTTWDIAQRFGLTVEELAACNTDQDLSRLQIGQVIRLNTPRPWLQVVTKEVIEEEQPVIGTTYYEKVDSMYVGEQKLKTQGQDGLKNVVIERTFVNGRMEHEEVISEEVVLEPVHTVMLTGSKWREVAASGEFINPTSGILTSRYGTRWGRMHEGIDIGAPTGTPIKAADAGVVTASRYISGYGYTVILDHGNGINTLYGHASALLVEVGQTVEKNAVIARVGTSGSTTGSCLHFEVRLNGEAIDPLPYVNYE